jgi:His/Glu/Gln/Arg/opine family amino acid ABC transporter permease subunit
MSGVWALLSEWLQELVPAALQTLWLTLASFSVAAMLAIPICALRMSPVRLVRNLTLAFIEIVRGLPILVILFLIYFGLPTVAPSLRWSSQLCAVIGFGVQGGVILAEVYRAGMSAVDWGEKEAIKALGLTPLQGLLHVTGPQAFRISLPPVGNYLVGLLKDTSIASVIAAPELMLRAKDLSSASFMPMPVYCLVAVLYFILSYPLAMLVRKLETKKNSREESAPQPSEGIKYA